MNNQSWDKKQIVSYYELPFFELINQAFQIHKQHFDIQEMEYCTLASIKTGACPEDCAYCPQSGHYNTGLKKEKLLDVERVLHDARQAKAKGAKRFCMGAAWRTPPKKDFPKILEMIQAVKALGLETCVTLGMLDNEQAQELKKAGLDFYNHNLDTSFNFYSTIIQTRSYQDRIETIKCVSEAGINVCCGGILGMGEEREDRIELLLALYDLPQHPKSIPINKLIPIKGTPLEHAEEIDSFEFIRTIAVTRIMFPKTKIRLSAGRENMSEEFQAWCFMAGANSIFIGEQLLTAKNPDAEHDVRLLKKLDIRLPEFSPMEEEQCC
tara:strand:+ start:350 stop:1321 length:972 start_codon:yes stop_codon:yes gene_type:complete